MVQNTSSKNRKKVVAITIRFSTVEQLEEIQNAAKVADMSFNKFAVQTLLASAAIIARTPKRPSLAALAGELITKNRVRLAVGE